MIQRAVFGASLVAGIQQVASFPSLYDSRHGKCTIPDQGFMAHGDPVESQDITIDVLRILDGGTESVNQFVPGQRYTLEISLAGRSPQSTNIWVHVSTGIAEPHDTFTDSQARTCEQAAFSMVPKPLHNFLWTAPEAPDCVIISVAMSGGASQAYTTSQISLCAARGATPVPAAADDFDSGTQNATAKAAKITKASKKRHIGAIIAGTTASVLVVLVVVALMALRAVCIRQGEHGATTPGTSSKDHEACSASVMKSQAVPVKTASASFTELSQRDSSKVMPPKIRNVSGKVVVSSNRLADQTLNGPESTISFMYAAAYPTQEFTVESTTGGTVGHLEQPSMAGTASSNISKRMEYAQYQIDSLAGHEILDGLILDKSVHSRLTGGQAVIQFAKQKNSTLEYAIKFYLSKAAFTEEAALYTDSSSPLGKFLPVVRDIVSNEDGKLKDSDGTPMPPFICMEKGESLDMWTRRNQDGVDMITGLQVIYHIAARLQDLHEAGYCHRDLKPGNVMWLPRQNRWTLIDFGCAAMIGDNARIGYSLAYAAPEVILAVRANSETIVASDKLDAWSLGVMAVELLSNKAPFNLLEGGAKVMDKIAGVTPLLWEDPHTAPALFRKFGHFKLPVLSLLERDPAKRPSMDQFLKQCNRVLMNTTKNEPSFDQDDIECDVSVDDNALVTAFSSSFSSIQ